MRYELVAILAVIACVIILLLEYLWLYILADRQEEKTVKYDQAYLTINSFFDNILASPTETARRDEVKALSEYLKDDHTLTDMACDRLLYFLEIKEELIPGKQQGVDLIYEALQPIAYYAGYLEDNDIYRKSYACRKLADFNAVEKIESVKKLLESKNRDLRYNAAMALSRLGDRGAVIQFIQECNKDEKYSSRIMNEMITIYTGDMYELVNEIFEDASAYTKATVIKAIAPMRIEKLVPMYLQGLNSKDDNLKIAYVKALSAFGNPEFTHELIVAANDKNWVVRCAALKGLSLIHSDESINAVTKALTDEDWWVRQSAAKAITALNPGVEYFEKILKDYDKYASDALKYSLYKQIDLNGDDAAR